MKVIMIVIEELENEEFSVVLNNLAREDATPKEEAVSQYFENLYLANIEVLNPISTEIIKKEGVK